MSSHTILLFYKYVTIADPAAFADWVRATAAMLEMTGRVLVAEEGINGTLEGSREHADAFSAALRSDPRFADISIKESEGDGSSFPKLSVKVRDEIVGTKFPKELADPEHKTAPKISPEELKRSFENGDEVVVIDMRNDYEFLSGHFKGSINPGLEASRDLPDALPKLEQYKQKKVVTVCTGGIRCEKMSAFLMNSGFTDVSQLEDGIHAYMQKYPGEDFLGSLYTFDQRKTMHFGGDREIVGQCYFCEAATEDYVNCANDFCHRHFLVCSECKGSERTPCSEECKQKWVELVAQ